MPIAGKLKRGDDLVHNARLVNIGRALLVWYHGVVFVPRPFAEVRIHIATRYPITSRSVAIRSIPLR